MYCLFDSTVGHSVSYVILCPLLLPLLPPPVSSPLAVAILKQSLWLKGMLFNPSSQAARKMACNILYSLCDRDVRQKQILDLLSTFLDQVGSAGEASKEYLELFQKLTQDETGRWKLYLARREILLVIGKLIVKVLKDTVVQCMYSVVIYYIVFRVHVQTVWLLNLLWFFCVLYVDCICACTLYFGFCGV